MKKTTAQSVERPPVVVVMGHVDHGKSTLLDFIRQANVVAGEHGGITQHVAAYEVEHPSKDTGLAKKITFIDTPGHAAFSAIRARGANVADIAILVVAADDGVKAQTLEALQQIRDAKIPFIVAINKVDKPNADINRTQASLMEKEVFLEKMGGDVPWAAISAKTGQGVDELLDLILLVAELQEYRADSSTPAEGYVIEAHRDQKRGIAATLIITSGTLSGGMAVLAGRAIAPVRIMESHLGKALKEATFSTPVGLIGFDELPAVGSTFRAYKNKKEAEAAREAMAPLAASAARPNETSDGRYYMPVIVRADATGSLEAILQEIARLGDEYARVSIVQSGIGNISEGDVKTALAGSVHALIIGFNVGIDSVAEPLARERNVQFEFFNIIYKLTERMEELLRSAQPKRTVEEIVGRAKILKVFSSRKDEHVFGGAISEGYLGKNSTVRIVRRKVVVGEGKLLNIQANKQNVDRAEAPSEFGAQLESSFEPAEGDIIECFTSKIV
ncbi:MAG: translation initiation factor IF-2 [Minisyncoccota bacterium]